MRLYCGYHAVGLPWPPSDEVLPTAIVDGKEQRSAVLPNVAARALNPFLAQRCKSISIPLLANLDSNGLLAWISGYLNGMGFTQGEISSLTTEIWQREPNKYLWQKIAALYTVARSRGEPGLVLSEFIKVELAKNGHAVTPEEHLRRAGFVGLRQNKPRGEQKAWKTPARARNTPARAASETVRIIARPESIPLSVPGLPGNEILALAKRSGIP
jgi:hypothetical protein